ncbi:MAG: hypothetical protein ACRDT8_21725 [Micromonosporaceae bacterium]
MVIDMAQAGRLAADDHAGIDTNTAKDDADQYDAQKKVNMARQNDTVTLTRADGAAKSTKTAKSAKATKSARKPIATRRAAAGSTKKATAKQTTAKRIPAKKTSARESVAARQGNSARRSTSTRQRASNAGSSANGPLVRWSTMSLPIPVGMRTPDLHLPHVDLISPAKTAVARAAHVVETAQSKLPAPRRIVYYGALGALAAVGVLEWPAAAAIGVGVWVATQARNGGDRATQRRTTRASGAAQPTRPHSAKPKQARPAARTR